MFKGKPIIYGTYTSTTVNAVLLTLKALQVDYEFCEIRPKRKDNLSEEYLRKNPAGTVPTLQTEDKQFIGESHAINMYLVDKYGKLDDPLYPKDLYRRAKVNELLHFENSVLFLSCIKAVFGSLFGKPEFSISDEILDKFDEAYDMLERYIGENNYVAGPEMRIADFSCIVSVYTMSFLRPVLDGTHPRLANWLQVMEELSIVRETLISNTMGMGVSVDYVAKKVSKL